mmetsp:Transcript_58915/g.156000  ORF Transcript_58915/g.156000 Transcript_58915/m.156000 type:complete len:120 (-) Transcript_58915:1255-1614(-)
MPWLEEHLRGTAWMDSAARQSGGQQFELEGPACCHGDQPSLHKEGVGWMRTTQEKWGGGVEMSWHAWIGGEQLRRSPSALRGPRGPACNVLASISSIWATTLPRRLSTAVNALFVGGRD